MVGRSACSAPTWALRMRCHCHPMQVAGNSGCSETGVHPPVATVAFAGTKVLLYASVSLIINWLTILLPSHPHPLLPCRTAYAKIPEGACRHRRGLGAIAERGRALVCTVIRTVAVSDCDRSLLGIVDGRPDWPRRGRLRKSETGRVWGIVLGCSRSDNASLQYALWWKHVRRLWDVIWQRACRFCWVGCEGCGAVGSKQTHTSSSSLTPARRCGRFSPARVTAPTIGDNLTSLPDSRSLQSINRIF